MSQRRPAVARRPRVALVACVKEVDRHPFHCVGDKYLRALTEVADAIPVLIPAIGLEAMEDLLDDLDGLVLTGSPSNICPSHYGKPPLDQRRDPRRDGTTLPLVRHAHGRKMPVLGICRGAQEMLVALGGSLHQSLADVPGRMDHFRGLHVSTEQMYAPFHGVTLAEHGLLQQVTGRRAITVNSIHIQGFDQIPEAVVVDAWAPDGQPEAIRARDPCHFFLGVQWHPEWQFWRDPHSPRLFGAFGDACRRFAASHLPPVRAPLALAAE